MVVACKGAHTVLLRPSWRRFVWVRSCTRVAGRVVAARRWAAGGVAGMAVGGEGSLVSAVWAVRARVGARVDWGAGAGGRRGQGREVGAGVRLSVVGEEGAGAGLLLERLVCALSMAVDWFERVVRVLLMAVGPAERLVRVLMV